MKKLDQFCDDLWSLACHIRRKLCKKNTVIHHPFCKERYFIGCKVVREFPTTNYPKRKEQNVFCSNILDRNYDGKLDVSYRLLSTMGDLLIVDIDGKLDLWESVEKGKLASSRKVKLINIFDRKEYILDKITVYKITKLIECLKHFVPLIMVDNATAESIFPPFLTEPKCSANLNYKEIELSSKEIAPKDWVKYADERVLQQQYIQILRKKAIDSHSMERRELILLYLHSGFFSTASYLLQTESYKMDMPKDLSEELRSSQNINTPKHKTVNSQSYKEVTLPTDLFSYLAHKFTDTKLSINLSRLYTKQYNHRYKMLFSETGKEGNDFTPITDTLSLYDMNIISKLIKEKILEFVKQIWPYGEDPDDTKLEDLVSFLNKFIYDKELQARNKENLKRLYDIIEKNSEKFFSMDDGETSLKYLPLFDDICKLHIDLPIEGEVSGIYLLEKYGEIAIDYEPKSSFQPSPNKTKISKMTNKYIEKLHKKLGIKFKKQRIKDSAQKFNSANVDILKINNQFVEEVNTEEPLVFLRDLLEYLKHDAPLTHRQDMKRSSSFFNWFLMMERPSWNIFEQDTKEYSEHHRAFIFIKSVLMKKLPLTDIIYKNFLLDKVSILGYWYTDKFLYAPLSFHMNPDITVRNTLIDGHIKSDEELCYDYKRIEYILLGMNTVQVHQESCIKDNSKSIYELFFEDIILDEIRFIIAQRYGNNHNLHMPMVSMDKMRHNLFRSWYKTGIMESAISEEDIARFLELEDTTSIQILKDRAKQFEKKIWGTTHSGTPLWYTVLLLQICQKSDSIFISPLESYDMKRRNEPISLRQILVPKSKIGKHEQWLMIRMIEKQFFWNMDYKRSYTAALRTCEYIGQRILHIIKGSSPLESLNTFVIQMELTWYSIFFEGASYIDRIGLLRKVSAAQPIPPTKTVLKEYPDSKIVLLPDLQFKSGMSIIDILCRSPKVDSFSDTLITISQISNILYAIQNIISKDMQRKDSRFKALVFIKIYIILSGNIYIYSGQKHLLEKASKKNDKDPCRMIESSLYNNSTITLVFVQSNRTSVSTEFQTGYLAQNVNIIAGLEGLGTYFPVQINTKEFRSAAKLDDESSILFAQMIGCLPDGHTKGNQTYLDTRIFKMTDIPL